MWIIYRHIAPNGKSYIGQTLQSPDDRWKDGFGYLKTRTKFAKAIIDFGWSAFKHEILETDIPTIEIANEREIYWIEYYNSYYNGYNSTLGGSGLKDGKHIYKIDMLDLSVICEYSSIAAAGREYGTAKEKCISDCCERKMHSSCGFYWCYTEDFNENESYIEDMENKLVHILEKVDGVGQVEVMITLKSSRESVLNKDASEESQTEEENSNGTKKYSQNDKREEETVLADASGESAPYVIKELAPEISGVIIACEGADNNTVAAAVTQAAQVLFGISSNHIKVLKMEVHK